MCSVLLDSKVLYVKHLYIPNDPPLSPIYFVMLRIKTYELLLSYQLFIYKPELKLVCQVKSS